MSKKNTKKKEAAKPNIDQLLSSWQVLNRDIATLTEQQCADLLEKEKSGKKRMGFLMRLYGRFNTLRTLRERAELGGAA